MARVDYDIEVYTGQRVFTCTCRNVSAPGTERPDSLGQSLEFVDTSLFVSECGRKKSIVHPSVRSPGGTVTAIE